MNQIRNILTYRLHGSPELYRAVRAGFIANGSSLNRWCMDEALTRQTVEKALRGERTTLAALRIVEKAAKAAISDAICGVHHVA